ncbi:MAG: type IV secretion system protein [Synergistaceae bacterium]|nr:type IV secretion system protein [Synergistaceae bacterium]
MNAKKNEEARILESDPFLAGRTEAAERYGHLAKNAAQWRRISLVLLICCAACVLAVIHMAGQITVVPYIVQVDQHGYEIAVKPVTPSRVDDRLLIAHIGRYIWSLKTVFTDPEAQLHLMNFVYNSTPAGTAAETRYREHFRGSNPVNINKTETISVIVNTVLPLSAETWQAEWTEERYTLMGNKIRTKHYRGIFTTAVVTPQTMQEILVNPLGIFITDFTFSEIL